MDTSVVVVRPTEVAHEVLGTVFYNVGLAITQVQSQELFNNWVLTHLSKAVCSKAMQSNAKQGNAILPSQQIPSKVAQWKNQSKAKQRKTKQKVPIKAIIKTRCWKSVQENHLIAVVPGLILLSVCLGLFPARPT